MLTAQRLRASATAFALALGGGLAIALAVTLVTAPLTPRLAVAQTVANPNDQPTAATLPPSTGTVKRDGSAADRPTGNVSAPNRIRSSTEVVGSPGGQRVDPLDHLSEPYRRNRTE